MRQKLLSEIKFRGIASNILLIGGCMSIWALCEFCSRVWLAGFLTAVFFVCLVFLASMVFRLLAARQISELTASKLFIKTSSALIAILWLSMALHSINYVGFSAVEYAAVQIGGSFTDNTYSVIGAVANNFLNIRGTTLTIFSCRRFYFYYLLLAYAWHVVLPAR